MEMSSLRTKALTKVSMVSLTYMKTASGQEECGRLAVVKGVEEDRFCGKSSWLCIVQSLVCSGL